MVTVPGGALPLRVLVVEDNDIDAMVAQAAVEKAVRGPREILRAATLKQGLAILRSGYVDLLLLDLNLPDSLGLNTLKRMRVATSCPIIVLTAEDRPGLDEEALDNGAFEILHKGGLGKDSIARLLRLAADRRRAQGSFENAEDRFRSLTDLSADWYWEQDAELRFSYYSPGFALRSGATPEMLLGTRRWDEPGRAPLQGTWAAHRALLMARKPFRNMEFIRVGKDGTRAFQSVSGEPFYDKAGNFAGYRGTSRDVTERKRAADALDHTRARLELALAASRVCTWDLDLRSGEVQLSESWAEMIGTQPGETRSTIKDLLEMVHPEEAASLRSALAETVKDLRKEYSVEHRVRHQSGEWRWIASRGKVIERDARGRAVRAVGSNLDISERKRGETLLSGEKQVLEMIARGTPLKEILTALMRVIETQSPGMLCSVLLLDPDGMHLRHGSAPSLPEDYTRAIDGLAIGASVGSCGTAAFRRELVIVEDIAIDPLWADFRELALGHGLRACWSTPIFNAQDRVLGTFAIYYRRPGLPTAHHRWLIDFATQLAAIAITRQRTEAALGEAKQRLENALESSDATVWIADLRTNEVWLSAGWAAYLGKPRADTHTTVAEMLTHIHPDDHRSIEAANNQVMTGEVSSYVVQYRVKSEGGWIWIASRGRVTERDAAGCPLRSSGACANITPRKLAEDALHKSEARFRSLLELSSDWYWEQDVELRFTYVSPSFSERTDGDPTKILGRRRWEFDNVVPASGTWPEHRAVLEAHRPFRDFEQVRVGDDGARHFISSSGIPVFNEAGDFQGYRGVSSNITARRSAEKKLVYLAQFDAVTGLPNRALLQEKLEHAIAQSRRRGRGAGVLFIDLDRFKLVNDTLGHQAGDALLSQVGISLRDCVRLDDSVGRLAGDEFVVVIADLARPEDAALVAQKVLDSFAGPFDLDGQEIYLTASIGIAAFPGDGEDAEALLKCADAAMYRAKESSGNSLCFYTAEMNERTAAKFKLNTDLRRAVERKEFRLYYQPKVNLASGALTGMEALLRWQHPERGMIPPLDFIPALEETGLIVAVGDWVVEEACRQLRDWTRDGLEPVPIAVNLSARQFGRRDLDAVIRGIVEAHGLQAELLELEITESSLMRDPVDAIRQLHALRAAGLRISVDDFGTGYSSLSYLTRLPLSTLKIDRTFVNAAIADPNSAAIVRMVIDMAKNLRFDVVAEGIETDQHVAFLRQHGCEQGQGYHFGRPAPAVEVAARLSRRA